MAVAQQFWKDDQGIQALLNALNEQIQAMNRSFNTVTGIYQDISSHYQADSATAYLGKVQDWLDQYRVVINQVDRVMHGLTGANRIMDGVADEALTHANSWTPASSAVYGALTG